MKLEALYEPKQSQHYDILLLSEGELSQGEALQVSGHLKLSLSFAALFRDVFKENIVHLSTLCPGTNMSQFL